MPVTVISEAATSSVSNDTLTAVSSNSKACWVIVTAFLSELFRVLTIWTTPLRDFVSTLFAGRIEIVASPEPDVAESPIHTWAFSTVHPSIQVTFTVEVCVLSASKENDSEAESKTNGACVMETDFSSPFRVLRTPNDALRSEVVTLYAGATVSVALPEPANGETFAHEGAFTTVQTPEHTTGTVFDALLMAS